MGRLEGKVAIITGVSHAGQAGFALAKAFTHEGADLVISARSEERVNARAKELHELGANVIPVAADLTSEEGAKDLIAAAQGAYESIDILVNLAGGLTKFGPSDELTLADWQAELNNNLLSTFLCTRAVWPIMRQQGGGSILNFSRAGGVEGSSAHMLAYNCAKAGIDALTHTFAKEGKHLNIRVNAIGPGLLITESNVQSVNYPWLRPKGLHLCSTATQSTDEGALLWLLRMTHQGRLTTAPSYSNLVGGGAFAS